MNKSHVMVLLLSSSLVFAQQELRTENYEKYPTTQSVRGKKQQSSKDGLLVAEGIMSYPGYGTTTKHFVIGQSGIAQSISTKVSKEEGTLLVSFMVNFSNVDASKELILLDLKVLTSAYKGNSFVQLAVKNQGSQFAMSLIDSKNPENRANPVNGFTYNEDHLVVLRISNFNTAKATCELFVDEAINNLKGSIAKLQGLQLPLKKQHEATGEILFTSVLHQDKKGTTTDGKAGLLKISRGTEKSINDLVNAESTKLVATNARQGVLQLFTNNTYQNAEIIIYGIAGNVVQRLSNVTINRNTQELRINQLQQGVYMFSIQDSKNQYQTKFIAK
ncbi:T9SS type A sorting domain-containing protein [uncultured Chryseobacterium sp.]|uniref:T9SS type A sorting domain-containing protein n=1 Tax=uncultured Chryseobacterium sp. TaxID=259322 RepID=UPI0027DD0C8D|nr:T9SS type A sorting domain-containing protein [uncultured Chryseobacterium sp.]